MADSREATMFKKVADGYVFGAPNPWVFGRARCYLVDEAQKAKLLSAVTARSQIPFWVAFVVLIAASTAIMATVSGHSDPMLWDGVIMLALLPVWCYGALLVSIRPTALRLQPLLAGLAPTDQRIAAADLRTAARKQLSIRQYLMLGVSQALVSAALIVLAVRGAKGGRVAMFENGEILVPAIAAIGCAVSSISLLFSALRKAMDKQDQPAKMSFKIDLLPILCLLVSIGLLGFVATHALQKNERDHRTALLQGRLDSLKARMDGSAIRNRQAGVDNAARDKETAAFRTQVDAIQAEINAIRR